MNINNVDDLIKYLKIEIKDWSSLECYSEEDHAAKVTAIGVLSLTLDKVSELKLKNNNDNTNAQ